MSCPDPQRTVSAVDHGLHSVAENPIEFLPKMVDFSEISPEFTWINHLGENPTGPGWEGYFRWFSKRNLGVAWGSLVANKASVIPPFLQKCWKTCSWCAKERSQVAKKKTNWNTASKCWIMGWQLIPKTPITFHPIIYVIILMACVMFKHAHFRISHPMIRRLFSLFHCLTQPD